MDTNKEKPEITGNKEDIRNEDGTIKKGHTLNPAGRPKGTENFSTKWFKLIDKLAKQNNIDADEVEQQLLMIGYKKAKDGDYRFYQDVFDRIYGKPRQTVEVEADIKTNNDGLSKEEREALLKLLND